MNRLTLIVVLMAIAASLSPVFGQASDGNIAGTILDSSGAVIPRATVELENVATGVKRTTETDQAGNYLFQNVLVGRYRITARASGFTPAVLENVVVNLNRTTTANLTLSVGQVTTQVEVVEAAALIDTRTATIGSAFSSQEAIYNPASSLPLGVYNLALLSAGVASSGGLGLGEGPSVGGQRPRQNSFTIEGVDNNRKDVTGANIRVPNEAVAEFSALQNQYSAEFGHSTGGQFNVAIRSGTNEYHGAAYWYLQNRKLNAMDQADKRQGITSKPRYDQNVVGANLGGPIQKNKLFFFGLFEYNPFGAASSPGSATYTPTAQGYALLDTIPGLSKTNLDILKKYAPAAPTASATTTVKGVQIPIGILPISFPNYSNTYNWLTSIDYNLSTADQLRFRYIASKYDGIDISVSPNLPAFADFRKIRQRMFSLSEFHNFSPTLLNELRLAYNYYSDSIPAGNFQFPGLDVFPNIEIQQDLNLQLGPLPEAPQSGSQNSYQLVNNMTWTRGLHTIKGGIDARRYIAPTLFIQRSRGDYNYSTLEQYLLDLEPDLLAERNVGGRPYWGNAYNFYWFIQDEMKLKRNITLTLGLRHEYKGIPADDKLQRLNAISSVPGLIEFREPKAQKKNFAPRVGLTWSPGTSGKLVFRAGGGIAYDNYFDNLGTLSKPPQLETTIHRGGTNAPDFLKNGGIPPNAPRPTMTQAEAREATGTYIPDQRLPMSYQWTFGVERVLAQDYTLNVRYLGTRGSRLFVQRRRNVEAAVQPNRSLPTYLQRPSQSELDKLSLTLDDLVDMAYECFGVMKNYCDAGLTNWITSFDNIGNSTYHGLATELSRRFSKGLLFKGAYTWSKAIDDSTADLFSTLLSPRRPMDFQNMRIERSRSFLDRTHRFTFTWVYDVPWLKGSDSWALKNLVGNWTVSGTYTAESPQYATVQSGTDSNLNWDSASDRAIVNPAGVDKTGSDATALRNSAGQVVAYLAVNPNARYIKAGQGAFPNGGRQTLPLRGINNWDLSFTKRVSFLETRAVELKANLFNAFNHPQYIAGSLNTIGAVTSNATRNNVIPQNPIFNDPTQVFASNARTIHLILRINF